MGHSLARQGYDVAYVGGKGDQGIDLIAKGHGEVVAVQCKRYDSATITPNQIREFLGAIVAALATRGVFVTTSVFTEAARAFAEGHPIDLVDRTVLVAWLIRKGARGPGLKCKNCGAVAKIQSESTLAWACAVCNEFNLV